MTLLAPGLWLQRLTTREPTLDQIEVSIRALQEVLRLEARRGPSGVESRREGRGHGVTRAGRQTPDAADRARRRASPGRARCRAAGRGAHRPPSVGRRSSGCRFVRSPSRIGEPGGRRRAPRSCSPRRTPAASRRRSPASSRRSARRRAARRALHDHDGRGRGRGHLIVASAIGYARRATGSTTPRTRRRQALEGCSSRRAADAGASVLARSIRARRASRRRARLATTSEERGA